MLAAPGVWLRELRSPDPRGNPRTRRPSSFQFLEEETEAQKGIVFVVT